MAKKIKTILGSDGYEYPITSYELVLDENGESLKKKLQNINIGNIDLTGYATKKYVDDNEPAKILSESEIITIPANDLQSIFNTETPVEARAIAQDYYQTVINYTLTNYKNKEIIIEFMNNAKKYIPKKQDGQDIYIISDERNDYSIYIIFGVDENDEPNVNKTLIMITYFNEDTSLITDCVIKEKEIRKLNNDFLENNVTISNSLTIGITNLTDEEKGELSFNQGKDNIASGSYSHAEGMSTKASNTASHAEGYGTTASGSYSHAGGMSTTASGFASHAEGSNTIASAMDSHVEGYNTKALSKYQHVQGRFNIEDNSEKYAHIVGNGANNNARSNAHTLDWNGNAWYAGEVQGTNLPYKVSETAKFEITVQELETAWTECQAGTDSSMYVEIPIFEIDENNMFFIEYNGKRHRIDAIYQDSGSVARWNIEFYNAEDEANNIMGGYVGTHYDIDWNDSNTKAIVKIDRLDSTQPPVFTDAMRLIEVNVHELDSLLLGKDVDIYNSISIRRDPNTRIGEFSIAIGSYTEASATESSAIGSFTKATAYSSHAEGNETTASGNYSHAEGRKTEASGISSHSEGDYTTASGRHSHAEGDATTASGYASHSEGSGSTASGDYSHAENYAIAEGTNSHAEGYWTYASSANQHVQGKFNIKDTVGTYAHIVGNGTDNNARSNAHTLDWNGNAWYQGKVTVGADNKELATQEYVDSVGFTLAEGTEDSPIVLNSLTTGVIYKIVGYYKFIDTSEILSLSKPMYINIFSRNSTSYSYVKFNSTGTNPCGIYVVKLTDGTYTYNSLVRQTQVLTKTNTEEYIPTSDYHPSTKKYVDDNKVTKTSELTNDSNFVNETYVTNAINDAQLGGSETEVDLTIYQTKTDNTLTTTNKTVVGSINEIKNAVDTIEIPTKTSDLTNDSNFTTKQYVDDESLSVLQKIYNGKIYKIQLTEDEMNGMWSLNEEEYITINNITQDDINNIMEGDIYYSALLINDYIFIIQGGGNSNGVNGITCYSKYESSSYGYIEYYNYKIGVLTTDYSTVVIKKIKAEKYDFNTKIINKAIINNKLTLDTNRNQYVSNVVDGTEIVLPTVTDYTEIHLYFDATENLTLTYPSNIIWQQGEPTITSGRTYELIFTYTNKWICGYVEYGADGETIKISWDDIIDKPTIPTKTSDLTNDNGFITSIPSEYITETELEAKGYSTFSGSYNDLTNKPTIPSTTSSLTNDSGFITIDDVEEATDEEINAMLLEIFGGDYSN